MLSPSLTNQGASSFEVKFLIDEAKAEQVIAWAQGQLAPDPYGDADGRYETTTLYLDTEQFDVYNQQPGFRTSKYRIRQYGTSECVSLERKRKRGDRVRKTRSVVPGISLASMTTPLVLSDDEAAWFHSEISTKKMKPSSIVVYQRQAFVAEGLRLTVDAEIAAVSTSEWRLSTNETFIELLPKMRVLELKFADSMPAKFRNLLISQNLAPSKVSKYRSSIDGVNQRELQCRTS